MTEQSPRLARTLVAVAMRDHALGCFVCRSGIAKAATGDKAGGYMLINYCREARAFCAAWRAINNEIPVVGAVPAREVSDR